MLCKHLMRLFCDNKRVLDTDNTERTLMKHSIMITSLYSGNHREDLAYYVSGDSIRPLYCDALLPAEAVSKCILANHPIEEMIVLGNKRTYGPGDELETMVLKDGRSFYESDINSLSDYNLLRYRLAQFVDEMHIEDQDVNELLDEDEKEATIALLKKFLAEKAQNRTDRINRLFGCIAHDAQLQEDLWAMMAEELPHYSEKSWQHRRWAIFYLYNEMRDSHKLELLESNEDVRIRFVPTDDKGNLPTADALAKTLGEMAERDGEPADVDVYININSESTHDTLTLLNLMAIARLVPDSHINVVQVMATSNKPHALISFIGDESTLCNVSELLAGMRTFLAYGKTDLLCEYWALQGIENAYIDSLLYAMRVIDVGLSLCDINDIERGIVRLRELLSSKDRLGYSIVERYFAIAIEGIERDYGSMLDEGGPTFIDLVKWTYRKGMWQQALTIVEARAPQDIVDRGIFYYCNSEESRTKALGIFAQEHFDLKPFEKYKMYDVSHYFIKYYVKYSNRSAIPHADNSVLQKEHAKKTVGLLDATDDKVLQAYTRCTDREALSNLLFAYYNIGQVRNATNHAENEGGGAVIREEWDVSERMERISQALRFFIISYEKVMESLEPSDEPIMQISFGEINAKSRELIPQRPRRPYGERSDGDDNRGNDGRKDDDRGNDNRDNENRGSDDRKDGNRGNDDHRNNYRRNNYHRDGNRGNDDHGDDDHRDDDRANEDRKDSGNQQQDTDNKEQNSQQ